MWAPGHGAFVLDPVAGHVAPVSRWVGPLLEPEGSDTVIVFSRLPDTRVPVANTPVTGPGSRLNPCRIVVLPSLSHGNAL